MTQDRFRSWDFMRVLRLFLGIFIIIHGIVARDWFFAGAGILLSLMPILNIGCCSASSCAKPVRRNNGTIEDINYEEVH